MPDHFEIYSKHADQYESLVSREDYQQNIFRALNQIIAFDGLTVAEFGAGTGRLTYMLAPVVKYIYAFDQSQHMLDVAQEKLQQSDRRNWQMMVGEHRQVTLGDGVTDVAISGWSVCYVVTENKATWEVELAKALQEMSRVLRPGGILILIETLGTGREEPEAPAELVSYYTYLEAHGFQRKWIRTDYQFRDQAEGETLTRFFFGDAMTEKISRDERGVILPECTGIWWAKKSEEVG